MSVSSASTTFYALTKKPTFRKRCEKRAVMRIE
jgi:hypothetical protein